MHSSGCMCIDMRSLANRLTRLYDDAMAPAGMTVTQFSQLNAIQELGQPTLNQLSQRIGLERSTLGRNVRVLEKLGFVAMAAGEDARTRLIKITPAGRSAFKRAVPLWHGVQSRLTGALGAENNSRLAELMNEIDNVCTAEAVR